MPALNFQKQFSRPVWLGLKKQEREGMKPPFLPKTWKGIKPKRQTIRALRKDGKLFKRGDKLFLYTGMRTKQCLKLGETKCEEAQFVKISDGMISISFDVLVNPKHLKVGGKVKLKAIGHVHWLTEEERDYVARMDGFSEAAEMFAWFKKTHGLPFKGQLIKW